MISEYRRVVLYLTHHLVEEGIVDDSNDRHTADGQSNRRRNHREAMNLSSISY